MHSIQEDTIVEYITRSIPITSATLENKQSDHQTLMVEIEGTLKDKPIYILIDPCPILSYVSTRIVERYILQLEMILRNHTYLKVYKCW